MKLWRERKNPEEIAWIQQELKCMRQENKESAQRQRDRLRELKEVKEQLKANLAQPGRDLVPLLRLMAGDDKHQAKKAKGDLDKLFSSTKSSENGERRYISQLQKQLTVAEWQAISKKVKEAAEFQKVRYKFKHYDIPEHFMGMKRSPSNPSGELVSFINPQWIISMKSLCPW
jgi:hypothetical protein